MEFPFCDKPNTAVIICCHVMENKVLILYVSHDEDDGMWQFLCGQRHRTEEARLVSLKEAFDFDNFISALADMPCGYCAERRHPNDNRVIKKR